MIHKPVKYLRLVIYLALPFSCWNLIWAKIDFNRQIRPILSDKCFKCHGPDAKNQKSDFRLDTFDQAIQEHNGFVGLTPGSLEDSEIHWRIHTDDEIELMPPPESKHPLTEEEILVFRVKQLQIVSKFYHKPGSYICLAFLNSSSEGDKLIK